MHAVDLAGWTPIAARLRTAVVSQTVTFARPVDVRRWHHVRVEVPHLGGARILGRGAVSDDAGVLGATFGVSALIRERS
jgi:acyl-CoA thioesterase